MVGTRTAGTALLLAGALLVVAAAPAAAEGTTLGSDATGALFGGAPLAPGDSQQRCMLLRWNGGGGALDLNASAAGALAAHLRLVVEAGHGGGYADCTGFTPVRQVFSGSLADLGAAHGDHAQGARLADLTTPTGSLTVRVTVELDDAPQAQGSVASSSFTITATGAEDPQDSGSTPPATRPPALQPPPRGTPDPGAVDAPAGPAADEPDRSGEVAAVEDGPVVRVPLTPGPLPDPTTGPSVLQALVQVLQTVAARAVHLASTGALPALRTATWGLGALPVLLVFLAVQHRIDARDPKLREAPATHEVLTFDDVAPGHLARTAGRGA